MWQQENQANFVYSTVALVIAGFLGLGLIGGFVFLVMNGHGTSAGWLLGAGALSMVTGFRTVRLHQR